MRAVEQLFEGKAVNKLILIIEDCQIIRSLFFDWLELENFNVISAENGYLGLQLAKELQPDLILCDINMPKLDGYGVLKQLRENLTTAKTPFIFLTSETDAESRARAWQLGANDYLTKPVNQGKLLDSIANQFKIKQFI
jgi:DNA-binding response OmpR family regulator